MAEALWVRVRDMLQTRLSPRDFESWVRPMRVRSWTAQRLTLEVPSVFARDWSTKHLLGAIETVVTEVTNERASVALEVNGALDAGRREGTRTTRSPVRVNGTASAGRDYSFDNFVIGTSNSVAFRACRSVVEAPGVRFNPLVIHGGVGLGKTHLLSATAATLRDGHRSGVRLVTAERFVNELVHALRNDGMQRFRDRYRGIGVLIVDDVQFLAGKQRSQEEFIHTFNALRDLGKQIVLASDRPPEELTDMLVPLRNRLASGLLAAIAPPDPAMRIELVRQKLAERDVVVEPGVESFLACQAWSSVRQLEGVVLRLEAAGSLQGERIDETVAARVLGVAVRRPPRALTVDRILVAVSEDFGVPPDAITARGRGARVALARQVVMHLSRALTELSLKCIGQSIGRRDHSTVAHAIDRMRDRFEREPGLQERVRRLECELSRCGGVE